MIQSRDTSPKPLSAKWRKLLMRIPGYDPFATAGDCWFDVDAAERAIGFFRDCIQHVKGRKFAGKPFVLEEWQEAIAANLFGWKRPDGTRRYRTAFIFVPRKNGKTTFGAGLVNYVLFCDGEPGAECYSAAADKEQASLAFEIAKLQVEAEPALHSRATIYQKSIVLNGEASSYKPLSAEAYSKHGYNVHFVLSDELHAQPDRDLIDVLETGMGSRDQPMMVHITTSDFAGESICNETHGYAVKVRDGIIPDDSFLPVIYEAAAEDDWTDPAVWAKANPNLGVSFDEDFLRRKCEKAKLVVSLENTFKRLYLNIRTEQEVRWIKMDQWDACSPRFAESDLAGESCCVGIDFGWRDDFAAMVAVFNVGDLCYWIPRFWLPAECARDKRVEPIRTFIDEGLLTLTDGNSTDIEAMYAQLDEWAKVFTVSEVVIDPANARKQGQDLQRVGYEVYEFRQAMSTFTEPCRRFEQLLADGNLRHGGNKVMRWMASNAAAKLNGLNEIMPRKKISAEKIDGITAALMALGRTLLCEEKTGPKYYDDHEVEFI